MKNYIGWPDDQLAGAYEYPGPSYPDCSAEGGRYICSLAPNHSGIHQAWDISRTLCAIWEDDDEPTTSDAHHHPPIYRHSIVDK